MCEKCSHLGTFEVKSALYIEQCMYWISCGLIRPLKGYKVFPFTREFVFMYFSAEFIGVFAVYYGIKFFASGQTGKTGALW
jgi:hypothetical protein